MTAATGRSWGYWTRAKLGMLADYLAAFATASKGQSERIYLDAFAGEGSGLDRLTGEKFPGSALIALEAGAGAGFTKFRYFELGRRAADLESQLRCRYPDRDIRVYEGDCNGPFELKNTKGATLYHMIFATDNDAGTRIMGAIYAEAAGRLPEMLREARDRASGQRELDLGVEPITSGSGYRYEPPWEPRA